MRTTVNFLIVNMAVSDFLCTVFVFPKVCLLSRKHSPTRLPAWFITGTVGDALCKIVFFFQDVTVAVSLLSLLMIATERYYAISRPLAADPIPRRRCKMMILFSRLLASLMNATHFYTFKLFVEDEGPYCNHRWEPFLADAINAWKIEFRIHAILFVFIPFIIVTTLYSSTLIRIRRTHVRGDANSCSILTGRRRRQKLNRNVLRMLLAVVIVFGFCWFPFIICTYVVTYVRDNQNPDPPCVMSIIEQCAMYLAYFISPINPAIYFMFSENYRNGLTKLSGRCLYPF